MNHDRYRGVSEDVGNIPITIVSTASIDREGFFYFRHIELLLACEYYSYIAKRNFVCDWSWVYTGYHRDIYRINGLIQEDFLFENRSINCPFLHVFNFTISAGATRTFDLTIIDDNILERDSEHIIMDLGVYEYGDGIHWCDNYDIEIEDNDGKSLQYYCSFC